jgi:hypothetical protein
MILKKLIILSSVAVLTYVSANFNFVNLQAALTPPASYDYSYRSRTVSGNTLFYNEANEIVWYTRTGASFPYDFFSTGTYGPTGMDITMRFDKSTILWTEGTGLFAGKYRPHTSYSYIGSDNTVGTIGFKVSLIFDNQTNKDYLLSFDASTTAVNANYQYVIDDITQASSSIVSTSMNYFLIPAYRNIRISSNNTSAARYFDAWYLEDLGISSSYDNGYNDGYDEGEVDGYELGYDDGNEDGLGAVPIENLFTAIFAGVAEIFNINIFGAISLGTIIIAPIAIALLWYILGIVSGVGSKK